MTDEAAYRVCDNFLPSQKMTMGEEADETTESRKKRKAASDTRGRWTSARVPYDISYEMSE